MESDLSVFHRVDDPWSLPGLRLVKLAARLPAYAGAVAFRLREEAAQAAPPPQAPQADPAEVPGAAFQAPSVSDTPKHSYTETPDLLLPGPQIPGAAVVPATAAALKVSDMGHLFSFASG